jgi:hypothetical protein
MMAAVLTTSLVCLQQSWSLNTPLTTIYDLSGPDVSGPDVYPPPDKMLLLVSSVLRIVNIRKSF